ncbi:hypothetical protein Ctob_005214 [Chrysochromulina tobinii]|uniref:Uncharacterized protein n=1 Tax=Chrysochromulina tobinii TaxID=1460289 RepID=A0A0M0JT94_9EUKA|nr:hypothetical protein Ctob_005214 [Chrysochromulina tobinii]|eukprot:KOO29881.1 hypothetical protein Ctob_005214 [Chrysochromulina sp. CCMP291]
MPGWKLLKKVEQVQEAQAAGAKPLGWRFKLYTVHDSASGTYQVALQMRDSRELPVDFFVVCGPGIRDVRPTSVSHIFGRARDARTSTPVNHC